MKKSLKIVASIVLAGVIAVNFGACSKKADPSQNEGDIQETSEHDQYDASQQMIQEMMEGIDPSDYAYVYEKEEIVVGIDENYPFCFVGDNEWIGFEADLAKIFSMFWLEVGLRFERIPHSEVQAALDNKTIDCYWGGLLRSEAEQMNVEISDPYLKDGQIVVMKEDNASEYTSLDQVKDMTFSVAKDSEAEKVVKELGLKYVTADTEMEALFGIATQKAQAIVINGVTASSVIGEGTDYPEMVSTGIILGDDEYVAVFRKGSVLAKLFNAYMEANRKDFEERCLNYGIDPTLLMWDVSGN